MNRFRLYLHRLFRRPVITDPMRIYTRRLPDGIALDVEEYFTYAITTIADDEELLALFLQIVDDRSMAREHDGWAPEHLFLEELATKVGYEIRLREQAVAELGKRLLSAVPQPSGVVRIPGQREAGAA